MAVRKGKWKGIAVGLAVLVAAMGATPAVSAGQVVLAASAEEEKKEPAAKLDPYGAPSQGDIQKMFEEYRYEEILRTKPEFETAARVDQPGSLRAGSLTAETLQDALDAVNFARAIAGLERVVENTEFTEKAQHTAVLLAHLGYLTPSPNQPGALDDSFYKQAYEGAQNSNLMEGKENLAQAVFAALAEPDQKDFSTLAHRRWLLSADVEEVGFGLAEKGSTSYAATYVIDDTKGEDEDDEEPEFEHDLAWPAPNMPLELFDKSQAWSISLGDDYDDPSISKVKVTLSKRGSKRTWTFHQNSAAFAVSNRAFGQGKTIIFRPVNATYEDGDIFDVKIEGLSGKAKTLEYSVTFFQALNSNKKPSSTTSNKKDPVEKYQAIFRINGASGEIPKASVSNKNKVTMPKAEGLQKPGSVFAGWRSSSDGKVYQPSQALTLQEHTTFTAQWKPDPSRKLELDTKAVQMGVNGTYQFLVKGNNDIENLKVETGHAGVASVVLVEPSDPRGAAYQVKAKAAGTTDIRVTYRGQTVTMKVEVTPVVASTPTVYSRGSITLDTAQYSMAPGNQYTIGAVLKDSTGRNLTEREVQDLVRSGHLKVRDSRTGSVATLDQLSTGNFRVTGKNPGTCYIIYEIGGTHASVRIDVQKDVKPHGSAVRNTSYFTK